MNSDTHQQQERDSSEALEFEHEKPDDEKNSGFSIELPSVREVNNGVEEDDEPTTPTSSDHKIPVPITCPPAPRKPLSFPVSNNITKRKMLNFEILSIDWMVVINPNCVPPEALVDVPDIPAGDVGSGDRAKKAKKANVTIGSST